MMVMERARVIYGILWFLTVIVYSIPWARTNGKIYTGWHFTVPFSFTYLIGIILGLIVLLTKKWKFSLTIVAGILMILGVLGAIFGYALAKALASITGKSVSTEAGSGLAFLLSIIYTVVGALVARKM